MKKIIILEIFSFLLVACNTNTYHSSEYMSSAIDDYAWAKTYQTTINIGLNAIEDNNLQKNPAAYNSIINDLDAMDIRELSIYETHKLLLLDQPENWEFESERIISFVDSIDTWRSQIMDRLPKKVMKTYAVHFSVTHPDFY